MNTLDVMLRADDRAAMEAAMLRFGVLVEEGGEIRPAEGISIKWGVPIWTESPEFDLEGEVVSPGVQDPRFHADMRIGPPATETPHESGKTAVEYVFDLWQAVGVPGDHPNKAEATKVFWGVELIDPATVSSPAHRFL